jgi:alkanesulfonate monooxygenase SsuD/methylene tetrahydromethanopterin reductase-like flavin-dependent oxidoreductase (luciferase family)
VVQAIGSLRAERAALGEPPTGGSALVIRTVYVADSDEQAWAEVGPSLARFWQLASDNRWSPEPVTLDDLPRFTARYPQFQGGLTRESVVNLGLAFIGSPQTVAKQAAAFVHAAGPDSLVGMFGFGELNHDQVVRSMQLFSGAVLPALVDL